MELTTAKLDFLVIGIDIASAGQDIAAAPAFFWLRSPPPRPSGEPDLRSKGRSISADQGPHLDGAQSRLQVEHRANSQSRAMSWQLRLGVWVTLAQGPPRGC